MKKNLAILCCLLCSLTSLHSQDYDPGSDTWVCVDDLGRNVASSDKGVSRTELDTEAQMGMFYYIWHGQHGTETQDITRLLEKDPDNPAFGGWQTFHWGGKPVLGYYRGGTPYIVARHMQMLVDAGIDFYFFDVTNAFTYDDNVKVVMKEIDRRTNLGLKSPKLAFVTHSSSSQTVTNLYNSFYSKAQYEKYWFRWEGKPLILVESGTESKLTDEVKNYFTFRYSWAWETGAQKWAWLANYPQGSGTMNGRVEQISVAAAMHPSSKIGKSYHNGAQPAFDKYGLCKETPEGLFFAEQWKQAHKVHPPVVMITQWNEWMAQRFKIENSSQFSLVRPGATAKVGESYFVDVYNQEFSRDLEPSSESLIRDNYYLQLVSNIRQFKGVHPIPIPTKSKSIQTDGDFSQWEEIPADFLDEPGDVVYTSSTAQSGTERLRSSNDIVTAKVTKDMDSIYFYVATKETISSLTASNEQVRWMTLFINSDCDYSNGWYGYDLMVSNEQKKMFLYSFRDGTWEQLAPVNVTVSGKEMMLGLSRHETGMQTDADFDFKWIDNIEKSCTDVLYFLAKGEAAPNGRFNYRYKGSRLITHRLDGYWFLQSAYSSWSDKTEKAICTTESGDLSWDTQKAELNFVWQLTSNRDGTYCANNIATRTGIGPLRQPTLNGDGCGSPIGMSSSSVRLHIEMASNGAFLIHEGGSCTAHGKDCQPFHANGHNTQDGTAPSPNGITAWLDDNLDLSTWRLVDASALTYKCQLEALLDELDRNMFEAGTEFGTYREPYVTLFQEAYDKAQQALKEVREDWFAPNLLAAMDNLTDARQKAETLGYIPLPDGFYYIANAAIWDDYTTKAFHGGVNFMNGADFIKGGIASQGGKPLCIFQITFNEDDAHTYTIYNPATDRFVGKWKTSQVSMVTASSKAAICIEPTSQGTVTMHYDNENSEKSFFPVYYNKVSYTTTGKNYRIKHSPLLEDGLTEWRLIPTQAAEDNPYVMNDTLCALDTLLDSHPARRYPAEDFDAALLANFLKVRAEAATVNENLNGPYSAVLRDLQAAINALEGVTPVELIRSADNTKAGREAAYDLLGRPSGRQTRGVIISNGKKTLVK